MMQIFFIFESKLVHLSRTIGHWRQSREMPRDKALWHQALEIGSVDSSRAKGGKLLLVKSSGTKRGKRL